MHCEKVRHDTGRQQNPDRIAWIGSDCGSDRTLDWIGLDCYFPFGAEELF